MKHPSFVFFTAIIVSLLVVACDTPEKTTSGKYYLPEAGGDIGEMLVVMDSSKWQGELGKTIRQTFAASVPGLPQDEPFFTLRYISPRRFNSILKTAKNVIIVTTLDANTRDTRELQKEFTPESIQRIFEDTALFMASRKDEFAKGQEIVHLFSKDEATLIRHIRNNQERLVNHFNQIESKRIAAKIFIKPEKGIMTKIWDDHQLQLQIPMGYSLSQNKPDLVWLRFLDREYEKNIIIHHQPYISDEIFTSKNVAALRESITKQHITDIEKPSLYLTYQPEMSFEVQEVNFKGKFALETRGLWKLSDSSAGGPFLSYTFVDEKLNRLYYIEGYVYAPSMDKFKFIREMYTILWTFETQAELTAANQPK